MPHDSIGLFDTPPTRQESAFALSVIGVVFLGFLALLPGVRIPLGEAPVFIPTFCAILFVGELIVATLLYSSAILFRSRALTVLAAGYVLSALLLVPYALTFPGAFSERGLLHAGLSSTAWIMIARRFAAPISIMAYAGLKQADAVQASESEWAPPPVFMSVVAAAVLAIAITVMATVGHDLLPPMFSSRAQVIGVRLLAFNGALLALLAVTIGVLLRRRSSVLDTWLLVALATAFIQSMLNVMVPARFTVGFYGHFALMLVSHLVVLLALIAECTRLSLRLAVAMAAQRRERDTRMMSMEGVAAAISHEVGQPLTAVSLGAATALTSLTRGTPDPERAIRSLRDTIAATQRTFAVVKSVRAMFGQRMSSLSEFDLNELLRETVSLLHRELAAQGVSVRMTLDEAIPPVVANRVQIQRVLINLLTNAIESLDTTPRPARRIGICSTALDDEVVRVEVSDSGAGFTSEDLAQVFDPFFTTKPTGSGLGLSLSRTIVEDHGGRLLASKGADGGATFHLELRRLPAAA